MRYFCNNSSMFERIINSFMTDGGPYHIETSPLIYLANQWAGFYMIVTSVMKDLNIGKLLTA